MKFIQKWGLYALITLATSPFALAQNTTHDVVVVGAGSAGLYAAKTLIADGYDVLIIEAQDRIGGRVYSATLGDMRVELGAEEFYVNYEAHPLVEAHYGNGVFGTPYGGAEVYSMDNGTNTCWYLSSAMIDCDDDADVTAVDDLYNWYWRPQWHTDPNSTLADDVFIEYGYHSGSRNYHIYDNSFAGGSYATSLHKIGARSLALQDNQWDLGENNIIEGLVPKDLGYQDALETIWWDDVVANSDLLLSSPVTAIDTSGSDVIVTDANGYLHAARQVIVTVSIGVLQAEMIDFTPDLPASTVDAYNGIGIDHGMKIPIRFSTAWWETEGQLSWLVTEGLAGACWAPSDYKDNQDHVMMCYPMGDNAAALNDLSINAGGGAAGDAAIIAAVLADLDGTFPAAPGGATANYVDSIVQNWGGDPYTLGAYSFAIVGTYTTANNSKRKDLQDPVANNRIFFAGEASHTTHPSTVPGAIHEGERAANEVDSVNGIPNNPPPLPGPICTVNADCDDGAFCNGAEVCNAGTCEAGTPVACDDGAFCNGAESCNEGTDSCDAGTAPCDPGTETCDEGTDTCDPIGCTSNAQCDDGAWCNGSETCNLGTGNCEAGTAPACDDGAWCNGTETCNEGSDSCDAGTAPACDDGQFCTGTESCNEATDSCDSSGDPCAGGDTCNEGTDSCDPPGSDPVLYMSFRSNTAVPGVGTVIDEDVVSYDTGSGTWALVFDGSDVGLGSFEIDGLAILPGGDLLLSFRQPGTVGGVASDDSDVLRFAPTSLGSTTAGSFSMYLDGSTVGLTGNGEDIDAITLDGSGDLVVSTQGGFSGTGASGADEDLFLLSGGSFTRVFDGSDVGLGGNSDHDVDAASVTANGMLFSTIGNINANGATGADEDVIEFTGSLNDPTSGPFTMYLDLSALGIATNEDIGSLHIEE